MTHQESFEVDGSPERRLWQAVIATAIEDLAEPYNCPEIDKEYETRVSEVLFFTNAGFSELWLKAICGFAGLNSDAVKFKALIYQRKNKDVRERKKGRRHAGTTQALKHNK